MLVADSSKSDLLKKYWPLYSRQIIIYSSKTSKLDRENNYKDIE